MSFSNEYRNIPIKYYSVIMLQHWSDRWRRRTEHSRLATTARLILTLHFRRSFLVRL